jgi:hypothetical protein
MIKPSKKELSELSEWYGVELSETKKTLYLTCRQGNIGSFNPIHLKEVMVIAKILNYEQFKKENEEKRLMQINNPSNRKMDKRTAQKMDDAMRNLLGLTPTNQKENA